MAKKKKKCEHKHLIVSPVEERALGKGGLKSFRELTHFTVYCLDCKKQVAKYDRQQTQEAIKKDLWTQLKELKNV